MAKKLTADCPSEDNPSPEHCVHPSKKPTTADGITTQYHNCCFCGQENETETPIHGTHMVDPTTLVEP